MMNFSFITPDQLHYVAKEWKKLEVGEDMSYFQSYNWYAMLNAFNYDIRDKKFDIGYAIVRKNGNIKLIAPLWIVHRTFGKFNRKGIYLFGRGQWSDYLNFIYDEWDEAVARFLFANLKDSFHIDRFYFENLKTTTELAQFIKINYKIITERKSICVGLSLPASSEEYIRMLSKNSRQNIRTARNRAVKDNVKFIYDFDDKNVDIAAFSEFRAERVTEKNRFDGMTVKWRILNFISTNILHRGWYRFKEYAPYTHDGNSRFISLKTIDGKLCSAFNYGVDKTHRQIVLMAVSTNEQYSRYSPGILLLSAFIEKLIKDDEIVSIDFTRGNEHYKYALGGKEHYISGLEFICNE